jgi:hypothetical protein
MEVFKFNRAQYNKLVRNIYSKKYTTVKDNSMTLLLHMSPYSDHCWQKCVGETSRISFCLFVVMHLFK